jgi:hypothetical protein
MGLGNWIQEFARMHERARKGELDAAGLEDYILAREELASALLAAQRLELKEGQTARSTLRVQRTLQADMMIRGARERGMTIDVSLGGFAAMLGNNPPPGEACEVTLKMPGEPFQARAVVVGLKRQGATFHVSFAFGDMPKAQRDRLGFFVYDTVLAALKK